MEDSMPIEKLLHLLKSSTNSKKLVQILTALRKHVNATNHRQAIEVIKRCNSLKHLISCSQFDSNIRVIDLALSILGNCCMNATVVNDLNILQNLLRILDKHKKDSIYGRVFRIFGNICDTLDPVQLIQKESKVIFTTIEFLIDYAKSNLEDVVYSVPTLSMALRFVRKLVSPRAFNILAQEYKLISTLGLVLIKCTDEWLQNKSNDVLLTDWIKIIQIITVHSYKYNNLIEEFKNTEMGDALQCFGDIILLQPERITKVVLRLAKCSKNVSDLPIDAIITNLITQVEDQADNINGSQSHLLLCVCNIMDHLGYHDIIKNANIVTTLVKLLKDYKTTEEWSTQCCIYIAQSLTKCKFNKALMTSQLNANIIPIIVNKLAFLSGKSVDRISLQSHDKKEYKMKNYKRFKRIPGDKERVCDYDKYSERCASPSSCSDISSCGPFSPAATSNFTGEDSDSDNYSPLCSETEYDDEYKDETEENQDLIQSDTDDNRPAFNVDHIELCSKLRSELCSLMKWYCTIKPMHQHLGDTKVITILMNLVFDSYINDELSEKECAIIKSISSAHQFLIPFMATDIISQIYEVMDGKHIDCCSDCDLLQVKAEEIISNFLTTANSDSIKGDIAHILLTTRDRQLKENIVIAIPYVIRNKVTLIKLLLDCGGLNIFVQLLKDDKNAPMQARTVKSICTLATINLKIKNPVQKSTTPRKSLRGGNVGVKVTPTHIKIGKYKPPEKCPNEVTFVLDDGSNIKADGDFLNDKSDYFSALFGAPFLESQTREITLREVSRDSLHCLFELLKSEWSLSCTINVDYSIDTMLEVILLSDRFLLNDLNCFLVYHMQQQITLKTAPTIYKWSLDSGTNLLRIESIAFALVNNCTYNDKLELFNNLFRIGYTYQLVDDIRKLICQFL